MTTVIVGPTAVGKSLLAMSLARRYRRTGREAEIVNADSMLVYRGMDIGTAKPSAADQAEIRHHLIDILEITETATVAEFQRLAREAIADCRSRGVIPIVVGGSALYIRAIVDHFDFPGTDPELRASLEAELGRIGSGALHERLATVDPAAAAAILPGNGRRIVRALEVLTLTGRPFAASLPPRRHLLPGITQIGLDIERTVLDARIVGRVDQMWDSGLADEVRSLADRGLRGGLTASRALGYRQLLRSLSGEISEQQARDETVVATRQFARRQDSWFRRDERVRWLPAGAGDLVDRAYELSEEASADV